MYFYYVQLGVLDGSQVGSRMWSPCSPWLEGNSPLQRLVSSPSFDWKVSHLLFMHTVQLGFIVLLLMLFFEPCIDSSGVLKYFDSKGNVIIFLYRPETLRELVCATSNCQWQNCS